MCQCTPEIRTPFCGRPGCRLPAQETTPVPQDRETQAQVARIIFERIAAGEDVSVEQRANLILFLSK